MKNSYSADRQFCKVFKLDGISYLPHYRNPTVYVQPGFPKYSMRTYTADELVRAGALETRMLLFTRTKFADQHWMTS